MSGSDSKFISARVPCADVFNRVRSVGVGTTSKGRVVLVAPPAETALLTPAQARALRDRLDELASEAERQTTGVTTVRQAAPVVRISRGGAR